MQMLQKLLDGCGSKNAVLDALQEHKGLASVVRNVHIIQDRELQKKVMEHATSASISWDEACYGGLSVNLGYAINGSTGKAAYLRPVVLVTIVKNK